MKPILLSTVLLLQLVACQTEKECFDRELYKQYQNMHCTQDCPGVTCCDGKTYCNECTAAKNGIRVK